jgi:hypothetical protein
MSLLARQAAHDGRIIPLSQYDVIVARPDVNGKPENPYPTFGRLSPGFCPCGNRFA